VSAAVSDDPAVGHDIRGSRDRGVVPRGRARSLIRVERLVWLFPPLGALLAIWTISPRFALNKPSLVDDWYGVVYASPAFHALLHGHYDTAAVDFGGRFRPSYAIWNYLQWDVGTSATSLTVPTVWLVLRMLVVLLAIGAVVFALTRGTMSRSWSVAIGTAAAVSFALTRATAIDLAQFRSAEPLAVAGLAGGLLLYTIGLRRLLTAGRSAGSRGATATALVAGFLVYLFSVYLWEAAAGLLVLLPFLYVWLARECALTDERRSRRSYLRVAVVLLALPLVHQALNLVHAMHARTDYTMAASGVGGAFDALGRAAGNTFVGMLVALGAPVWYLVFGAVIRAWLGRPGRADPRWVLCVGVLSAGTVCTLIANFAAAGPSRYFLPWLTAVLISGAALLGFLSVRARVIVLALFFAGLLSLGLPRDEVRAWAQLEQTGAAAIDLTASVSRGHCRLYLSNFTHVERLGLARLVRYGSVGQHPSCGANSPVAYTLNRGVGVHGTGPAAAPKFPAGCRGDWSAVETRHGLTLFRCGLFHARRGVPDQDVNLGNTKVELVRFAPHRQLAPASTLLTVGAKW
jgi:hypothetical protein